MENTNPVGIEGIEFIEYSTAKPELLHTLFTHLGFTATKKVAGKAITLYQQQNIHWIVNAEPKTHAAGFVALHGPSVCSMGWRVKNGEEAKKIAVSRGARPAEQVDYKDKSGKVIPAIYGIGDCLIYFIDDYKNDVCYSKMGFESIPNVKPVPSKGFSVVDHLTNNVEHGQMEKWTRFYKDIFGFTEVRYFDIRGVKTGLTSFALRSPCGNFCIPINEAKEEKSQINEYLREYRGPGIQHIALLTDDIVNSLTQIRKTPIALLDVDPSYYDTVFDRVPGVTEDKSSLQELGILVDGDEKGYLLQIFTQNMIGPIFFEIIQRKNNLSFGEGNFGALFRSIERDQEKRGVL